MKQCGKCKQSLELGSFGIDRRYNKPRSYCKKCACLKEKEYRKINPDKIRASNIKHTYKVSLDEAYKLMSVSNCLICSVELTKAKKNVRNKTDQVVDHCHETGKVRGVLCSGCNLGLGHFNDDTNKLENAIKYINKTNKL